MHKEQGQLRMPVSGRGGRWPAATDPGAHSLGAESTAERDHNSIASDPPKGVVSMRASRSRGTPSAAQQGKKKTAKRPAAQKRRTAPAPSQSDVGLESPAPKPGRPTG